MVLRCFQTIAIIFVGIFKLSTASFSIHRDCVEYAKNHTVCTTMEACELSKCGGYPCESLPAIHFHNIAVILNKRLRYRLRLRKRLNPLLIDPAQTSIFEQEEPGAYCGQDNRLLRRVRVEVVMSEGVLHQLLRKAFFAQRQYLYARDDCLNKCKVFGFNLGCEMVPDGDVEVMKVAVFRRLQHMVFFRCSDFPMMLVTMVIVAVIFLIVLICELAVGISRINQEQKRIEEAPVGATEDESNTEDQNQNQNPSSRLEQRAAQLHAGHGVHVPSERSS